MLSMKILLKTSPLRHFVAPPLPQWRLANVRKAPLNQWELAAKQSEGSEHSQRLRGNIFPEREKTTRKH